MPFGFPEWVFLQEFPNSIERNFQWQPTRFSFFFNFCIVYTYNTMLRHMSAHRCFFCFATNAEKGLRQGGHNSAKTSNIEIIKFPIKLTLFFL